MGIISEDERLCEGSLDRERDGESLICSVGGAKGLAMGACALLKKGPCVIEFDFLVCSYVYHTLKR